MLGFQKVPRSYVGATSRSSQSDTSSKRLADTQKWKCKKKKKQKEKKSFRACMPGTGGLFRCQEVCLMVMGQMREEGWSRASFCFEDSPPPPRPVRLHLCNPTPNPTSRHDQRKLTSVCTCLCAHLFWPPYIFPGLCLWHKRPGSFAPWR